MSLIKTVLACLVFITLSLAEISGIVTDTGTTPISGVVVQLERGGQTATTGTDGSFTLTGTTRAQGYRSPSPQYLPARISRNTLYISIAEPSALEVTSFDLNGKMIYRLSPTVATADQRIDLPHFGSGIYLYKVVAENKVSVLKGHAVGSIKFQASGSFKTSSPVQLAKQTGTTGTINDVISAKKAGYLDYRIVAYNHDTSGVVIKMIESAGTVTDIDGNVYQTVRIGEQVWTTENLRVTKYISGLPIDLETSSESWDYPETPKYCYYENTTNPDTIRKFGALYNCYALVPYNNQKLAPEGWHVAYSSDWSDLEKFLYANGYGIAGKSNISKSIAASADWADCDGNDGEISGDLSKNNRTGFSAIPAGYRTSDGVFHEKGYTSIWWASPHAPGIAGVEVWRGVQCAIHTDIYAGQDDVTWGLPVRLIKD